MSQFLQMPESKQVGVYYLIGDDEEKDQLSVYIGQTGSLGKRLNEHDLDPKREFWNRALVAISLTHSLTQTHAMYLEWCSIQQANNAQRYSVENGNAGSKPYTPASLEADCQEIFDTIRTLVATMGQPVLEPLAVRLTLAATSGERTPDVSFSEGQLTFQCKGPKAEASGQYTEEGMVVLAGGRCRVDMLPRLVILSPGKHRQRLIDSGHLKLERDFYVFQRDVLFRSPSGASDVVLGRSSNGWLEWKDASGKTLDELKRQKSDEAVGPG